jgi:hypothetical protein
VAAALEMGPREKALYLKHRAKAAAAAQSDEEVASTLAGSTPAGLRTWIRQARLLSSLHPSHTTKITHMIPLIMQ